MPTVNARNVLFCGSFLLKAEDEIVVTLPLVELCTLRLTNQARVSDAFGRTVGSNFVFSNNEVHFFLPPLQAGNVSLHHEVLGSVAEGQLSIRIILHAARFFTTVLVDLHLERT